MGTRTDGGRTENIMNRFRLDGKAALVTGGGQGIGMGFARALGEAGAAVAVVDISKEHAEKSAHDLSALGIDSIAIVADVRTEEDVEEMVGRVVDHWGRLAIAVNNAGIGKWAHAEAMSREEWRQVIELNLNAVFFCAQREAKAMFTAGYGKIINTASMSGHIVNTPQDQAAYNASKAAVIHLTRSLAAEWASRGIRVNSISPGYTRTMLVEGLLATPEGKRMLPAWLERIPMRRMAEVADLEGAVVYLASAASDYMTGHDLVIDGGYSLW
jgi:NAD(P)-dependent dehydrogenase (short-subunit alcohol dehydrogenase family)